MNSGLNPQIFLMRAVFHALTVVLLTACRSAPDAGAEGGEGVKTQQTVVIMGSKLSGGPLLPSKIAIDYEEAVRTREGRLRVRLNIRNRSRSQQEIQAQTVFKDEAWNPVGEMVDWKLLRLGPDESRSYVATSESPRPVRYTVRIRPFG